MHGLITTAATWSQEPSSVNIITRVYASVPSMIHQTCSAFPIAGSIQITLRNQTILTLLHWMFQPKMRND